jgi:hypothetical protein
MSLLSVFLKVPLLVILLNVLVTLYFCIIFRLYSGFDFSGTAL